jgi:peptidoglycan/xylan/chitin deacetylase (PgdA/CDA1 family)
MFEWRICCYHEVEPVHGTNFARQLDLWKRTNVKYCSLADGLRQVQGKWLTITFDDGDKTVCEVAQPVLDSKNIKAMMYITTDYITRGLRYRSTRVKRPACTWGQLEKWISAGHEIGSHSCTHPDMTGLSAAERKDEMERSRELLSARLGIKAVHFAYPWGRHSRETYSSLREDGTWLSAATIRRGWNTAQTDPLLLKRDMVEPSWSPARLRLQLGILGWEAVNWLQRRFRGLPSDSWDSGS